MNKNFVDQVGNQPRLFFLVSESAFLWFWPESLFSVWVILLGFFVVAIVLTFLLYCTLEELVYFLFMYRVIQKAGLNFLSLYFKIRTSDRCDVNYI